MATTPKVYARGLSTREIETYISELYGPGVSRQTVSRVTASVLEDAKPGKTLEEIYPIFYLDALVVKLRDGHAVRNTACYLAIGVNLDGERDVLGIWFQKTEGAEFWLQVLTDLKTRGVHDVLVCHGLSGFPCQAPSKNVGLVIGEACPCDGLLVADDSGRSARASSRAR